MERLAGVLAGDVAPQRVLVGDLLHIARQREAVAGRIGHPRRQAERRQGEAPAPLFAGEAVGHSLLGRAEGEVQLGEEDVDAPEASDRSQRRRRSGAVTGGIAEFRRDFVAPVRHHDRDAPRRPILSTPTEDRTAHPGHLALLAPHRALDS
ncbi:MAG: hypothetical protein ACXW25_07190 [Rhodospirillales bacterium]